MAPSATPMTRKTIMSKIIVMLGLPLLGAPESRPGGFRRRAQDASALQGRWRQTSSTRPLHPRASEGGCCSISRRLPVPAFLGHSLASCNLGHLLLPMLAVEQRDARDTHRAVIEAAHIDAEPVRL